MFWRERGVELGEIGQLARKYLCITATSAASERVFSDGGRTCTRYRGRMAGNTLRMLVFVSSNMRLRKITGHVTQVQHEAQEARRKRKRA